MTSTQHQHNDTTRQHLGSKKNGLSIQQSFKIGGMVSPYIETYGYDSITCGYDIKAYDYDSEVGYVAEVRYRTYY